MIICFIFIFLKENWKITELLNIYFINLKKDSFFSLSKLISMVPDRGSMVTVVIIHSLHSIVRLFQARSWYSTVRLLHNIVRTFHKSLGHKQKQGHYLCVFFRSQKSALHIEFYTETVEQSNYKMFRERSGFEWSGMKHR